MKEVKKLTSTFNDYYTTIANLSYAISFTFTPIYTSDSSMDRFRTTTFQYHGTIRNVSFRPEVSTTAIDDEESDATHGMYL